MKVFAMVIFICAFEGRFHGGVEGWKNSGGRELRLQKRRNGCPRANPLCKAGISLFSTSHSEFMEGLISRREIGRREEQQKCSSLNGIIIKTRKDSPSLI